MAEKYFNTLKKNSHVSLLYLYEILTKKRIVTEEDNDVDKELQHGRGKEKVFFFFPFFFFLTEKNKMTCHGERPWILSLHYWEQRTEKNSASTESSKKSKNVFFSPIKIFSDFSHEKNINE